ncbi:MAG TPA: Mut7-C RNAse domain-containing protein, partial [Burkholderiaceae bacterium]|nr:Mut7-C RNAse domain-containing protein [Burkholderiaceae bacterium]
VFERLDLARSARPFTRCLHCNAGLVSIDKAQALLRLPSRVAATFERFSACEGCERVFWEGSHWRRMQGLIDELLASEQSAGASSQPAGDGAVR